MMRAMDGMRQRAALLLEVLVALTIMVAAMGLMGAQLVGGLQMMAQADERTRAAELADRVLALLELDPQTQERVFLDRETEGDFGRQHAGYFWRAGVELTDVIGLGLVTVEILYQSDPQHQQSIDGAKPVLALHMLKADPGKIDLANDFGLSEERIAEFTEQIPIEGFDPYALDPQALVSLPPEMLLELLPVILPLLQQYMGTFIAGGQGATLQADDLRAFIEQAIARGGTAFGDDLDFGGTGEDGQGGPLDELLRLQEMMNGGAPPGGGPPPGAVRPGGGPDVRGGARRGGSPPTGIGNRTGVGGRGRTANRGGAQGGTGASGDREYTIEDLLRLQEELEKREQSDE